MTPTAREVIANKPLAGDEVRELLRADFERLLDAEGLLSHYMAYGRLGWSLTLALHLDNPMRPESVTEILSRGAAINQPEIAAVEGAPPLANPSEEDIASALTLERTVTSPNVERLRNGLPVTIDVRQQDGTTSQQKVDYPPDPSLGEGDVTITDHSSEQRAKWGLKSAIKSGLDTLAGV